VAITVSDGLKTAATNRSGSTPIALLEIYPVSGAISTSKGLKRRIYDGYYLSASADDLLWTDTSSNLICFNYGGSPPLGITPSMLSDNQTWSIRWDGYIRCSHPEGVTGNISWSLGYVATGYVVVYTGPDALDEDSGTAIGIGSSPHSINDLGVVLTYSGSADVWWPITIWYSRSNASNRVFADERFVLFIKDDVDEEWQILGSDRTCPVGGRFKNLVNTPVTSVDAPLQSVAATMYTLNIHVSGGSYHFHKSTDTSTEYPLTPGQSVRYTLEGPSSQHGFITITWADSISNGDMVEVQLIAKDEPPWEIPVTDMAVETSIEGASTLRFSVPVTEVAFDEEDVDRTNFSTYDLDTDSFGVIRPNRMVRASFGYIVDGQPEYVTRFTGLIQDIEPSHKVGADGTPDIILDVTCMDSRVLGINPPITKIEDMILGAIPNELSYDIAQRFPESTGVLGGDGAIRPPAFDAWNLATVVRVGLYQAGWNATQLWAKDSNGNFLIDDRGIYLERTQAYPFSVISELGVETEINTTEEKIINPESNSFWWLGKAAFGGISFVAGNILEANINKGKTRTVEHWTEMSTSKDMPYLYIFDLDMAPWSALRDLCSTYGLELGHNSDGNVYMRYPNNPVLYSAEERSTTLPYLSYGIGWATSATPQAIGNVIGTTSTTNGLLLIRFVGVGIRLIFVRQNAASGVAVYIDNIMVDGINELDATTGDQGHLDWTDAVQFPGAYVELDFDSLPDGVSNWYYKDGIHPDLGKNPTVFTITDNLTYGQHDCVVQLTLGTTLDFEGFQVIATSTEQPQHEFDATTNLLGVELNTTLASSANDVIIAGNMRGAVGDYVLSRAVDMAAIHDENSPNYIGVRKPWYIADPRIINQERADFLAQHLLLRYRRGERRPVVQSSGLPWLEGGDPITIRDMHEVSDGSQIPTIGLYSPGDLTKTQRIGALGILPVPFQRYWVTDTSERFSKENDAPKYVSTVTTTALPPLPAYEPLPEPEQDESVTAISGIDITYDAGGATYNPFTADTSGEYVNIEFDMNWHARLLNVSIVTAQAEVTLPGGEKFLQGTLVNVLLARTGFVPAGHYALQWDGWIEGENGGMFAPDGNYSVRIETERYSTGAPFMCRSESGYPGVETGSKSYIEIAQDRDTEYGVDPFSVVLSPNTAPGSPSLLYDLETNSGQGLQITVTLACPAQIVIPITIRFTNQDTVPANDPAGVFYDEKWEIYLRGDDMPIMEPGTYTFYFNPSTDVTKDGRLVLPFGASRTAQAHYAFMITQRERTGTTEQVASWYVAWHFSFDGGITCRDKSGTEETINPANPLWVHYNWGGPRAATYTKAERSDQFVTWSFLDVKAAV